MHFTIVETRKCFLVSTIIKYIYCELRMHNTIDKHTSCNIQVPYKTIYIASIGEVNLWLMGKLSGRIDNLIVLLSLLWMLLV